MFRTDDVYTLRNAQRIAAYQAQQSGDPVLTKVWKLVVRCIPAAITAQLKAEEAEEPAPTRIKPGDRAETTVGDRNDEC